jgi:hypothetical protein
MSIGSESAQLRRIDSSMSDTPIPLDREQLRIVRMAAQGMCPTAGVPPMQLVERTGWLRTLGGADAYLALHARQRMLPRALIDDVVSRGDLRVVPSVRGCIYLVPKCDADLCLCIAESQSRARAEREHAKAGIKQGEIEDVGEAAWEALAKSGPMTTDALRRALPEGTVRSLGDAGKKVGISSPLPPALRHLEFARRIERRPEQGRLDNERYVWIANKKAAASAMPDDPAKLHALLIDRFVHHAGAATLAMFSAWSGVTQRDAKAALSHAKPQRAIDDSGDELLARADLEHLLRMGPALASAVAFLPFEDNLVHLFGGPSHLVDDEYLDLETPRWGTSKGKPMPPIALRDNPHLALRPLLVDGRIGGFWEYDPDAEVALPRCFHAPSRASQILLEEQSEMVSALLRSEIGHGRSFSLDTDDELRHRMQLLHTISGQRVIDTAMRDGDTKPRRMPGRGTKQAKPKAAATKKRSKPR